MVNLFADTGRIPKTMPEVVTRMVNLQFANNTEQDLSLMRRFNEVSALMEALAALPADDPVFRKHAIHDAYEKLRKQRYVSVPEIISFTQPHEAQGFDGSDFSSESIKARAAEGYRMAEEAARAARVSSGSVTDVPRG